MSNNYNEKSKESTMRYLAKQKTIRFYVTPEQYEQYANAMQKGEFKSMREFAMAALQEKTDKILGSEENQ